MDSLLIDIGKKHDHAAHRAAQIDFDIMSVPGALSPEACAALRGAVDRDRRVDADSVDNCPEFQLNLSHNDLEELIGADQTAALMRLPRQYSVKRDVARAAAAGADSSELAEVERAATDQAERVATLRECFVRVYSGATRPWNPFHVDAYRVTVNVALSPDAQHGGGRLLGVHSGRIHTLERGLGEATVHSSELLHGVTRMTHGTRYSLILFFDPRPRVVRKDGTVQSRWAKRTWKAHSLGERWWEQ